MPQKILLLFILCMSYMTNAQNAFSDLELALTDMVFLSEQFVTPGAQASSFQSSAGWVNSAEGLGLFKVDVSVHLNTLFLPSGKKTYDVGNSDLELLRLRGGASNTTVPTVLGGDTSTFFDFMIGEDDQELQAFEGVKKDILVHPFIQASVGLWKETDLTVRYTPSIPIDGAKYDIYGAGLKHSLSQYWKKETDSTGINLAVAASYSAFNLNLEFDGFKIDAPDDMPDAAPLLSVNSVDVAATSWSFQLVASKRLKRFELYGNVGLNVNTFSYEMGGEEGVYLGLLNRLLVVLDTSSETVRGEFGANYHFGDWYVSNSLTLGAFVNYNASLHYRF